MNSQISSPPLVIFDRDDTLVYCNSVTEHGDLGDPALVQLLPGVDKAIAKLKDARWHIGVATNQGGVARGRYEEADVLAVLERVNELLDGAIDAARYCPFHPKGTVNQYTREHPWRKPAPGMLLDIVAQLRGNNADMSDVWMIGDKLRDCEAGRAAGMHTLLIDPPGTTRDEQHPDRLNDAVDHWAPDTPWAVELILTLAQEASRNNPESGK